MELAVHLFALCVLAPLHAEAISELANQEKSGYHSWIENELVPATREILKDRSNARKCFTCECDYPRPRPYAAIVPYAEIPPSTKLQFSTKSLFAPTQALFGKNGKNSFRSAFATDGWDAQENEKLASPDESPESVDFAFPMSKEITNKPQFYSGPVFLSLELNH